MSVKIKICGITNEEDALWAATLGADFAGVNFYSQSPRKVSSAQAAKIVLRLPPFVASVGVFVDHSTEDIVKTVEKTGVKGVQLHGDQSPEECAQLAEQLGGNVFLCKAFRVASSEDLLRLGNYKDVCRYFLLDARSDVQPGGTGTPFPWGLAREAKTHGVPIFVAGGLTPENVSEAVKQTEPFAVDVASGVEKSPKRKDYDKMRAFIESAKRSQS